MPVCKSFVKRSIAILIYNQKTLSLSINTKSNYTNVVTNENRYGYKRICAGVPRQHQDGC